ncbi:MAG: hypothetical protein GVY16_04500 [Planctomycetes bacterium]|jgi:cystathionine beta-lyase/cystathionine gamma-synthase|nr:hypothetical protein [Planctomycetota bacterium]
MNMQAEISLCPLRTDDLDHAIVNAVNYEYLSFGMLRQITDGEIDGYTYHRDDNPTVREVARRIAELEGAEGGVVCTTGMRKNTGRLSTGIEPSEKLITDIKQALACLAQGVRLNG